MVIYSIDVTPWVVAVASLGGVLGVLVKRPLYVVFSALSALFGIYSLAAPYGELAFAAWFLAVFFGTASLVNVIASMLRRIEAQVQAVVRLMSREEGCR